MANIVNGKPTDGKLFETDGKLYLIELAKSQSSKNENGDCIDIRQLYEKQGQLGRTQKAARIDINDLVELIQIVLDVTGLPYTIQEQ